MQLLLYCDRHINFSVCSSSVLENHVHVLAGLDGTLSLLLDCGRNDFSLFWFPELPLPLLVTTVLIYISSAFSLQTIFRAESSELCQ